jgi:uncharacterized protein
MVYSCMTIIQIAILIISGVAGGIVSALAGGGMFILFPVIMGMGLPSIAANITSTCALSPATLAAVWVYRHHYREFSFWRFLLPLLIMSMIGGGIGAWLLGQIDEAQFRPLVPYLLLFATLTLAVSPWIQKMVRGVRNPVYAVTALLIQALATIYGGFFGAGLGIILLASLALWHFECPHQPHALKNIMASATNLVAISMFVYMGLVWWQYAIPQMVGTVVGGYIGGTIARRIPRHILLKIMVTIGLALSALEFFRA